MKIINLVKINEEFPVEIDDGIYVIESFLTSEEVIRLHELAENATQEEWDEVYLGQLKSKALSILGSNASDDEVADYMEKFTVNFWKDKKLIIKDSELVSKLNDRANLLFDGLYDTTPLSEFQRQYEGVSLDEHYDQGHNPALVRATVTYINDDYTDGELYFPDRGLVLKPKAGTMITFPASEDYVHGVKTVGPGPVRYVITSFGWAYGSKGYERY
jgi:2OG-Fe(II) oxygenase superfamily